MRKYHNINRVSVQLHSGTKSHSFYMILKPEWWHIFCQRINNHQFNANVFKDYLLIFNTFSYGSILYVDVLTSTSILIILSHKYNS